ncbi:MAG: YbhB/YbcL family Raf kinase inhibitor-like protein [Candidatus Aminicenantes bacterium]|nr:YbhB/YbcL family Raf kinase inhibitor-like protein [Candidatus Aminicenantes bacterium]
MKIEIKSDVFDQGGMIPEKYTCDGDNISPPLSWDLVPEETKSIAVICDDPDAPVGTWVHWVVYNIPPEIKELKENITPEREMDNGGVQGMNDFKKIGYGGPCPPSGTHRYFFKIYALDSRMELKPGATKYELLIAMESHILAKGELIGKYSR